MWILKLQEATLRGLELSLPRRSLMLLVPWVALLVFGTIMVSSASVAMAGNFVEKQFVNLLMELW